MKLKIEFHPRLKWQECQQKRQERQQWKCEKRAIMLVMKNMGFYYYCAECGANYLHWLASKMEDSTGG